MATHADSLIAEAVLKNITGIDRDLAWEAVWKDATVPPKDDATVVCVRTATPSKHQTDDYFPDILIAKR